MHGPVRGWWVGGEGEELKLGMWGCMLKREREKKKSYEAGNSAVGLFLNIYLGKHEGTK